MDTEGQIRDHKTKAAHSTSPSGSQWLSFMNQPKWERKHKTKVVIPADEINGIVGWIIQTAVLVYKNKKKNISKA